MYESYWNLKEKPFKNTPDPAYLFKSKEHEEALYKLLYAIDEDMGCAVLSGIFGCGKTVISQVLCKELASDRFQVAYINNPQLDYVDLLRSIVRRLKPVDLNANKAELSVDYLLETLEGVLTDNVRDGKKTVIIIDEAHIVREEALFESLRLLLNFQMNDRFMLTLILLGQPEVRDNIKHNKQFEQRVAVMCHLEAFDFDATCQYVKHRLSVAGASKDLFDATGYKRLFEATGGIPRRINRIADAALLVGCGKRAAQITEAIVDEAVAMIN